MLLNLKKDINGVADGADIFLKENEPFNVAEARGKDLLATGHFEIAVQSEIKTELIETPATEADKKAKAKTKGD